MGGGGPTRGSQQREGQERAGEGGKESIRGGGRQGKFSPVSLVVQLLRPLNDASPPFPRREMETPAEGGSKAICREAGRGSGNIRTPESLVKI